MRGGVACPDDPGLGCGVEIFTPADRLEPLVTRCVIITGVQAGALVSARREVLKKRPLCGRAEALTEQIVDLGSHRSRNKQPASLRPEQLVDLAAARVALVGHRD